MSKHITRTLLVLLILATPLVAQDLGRKAAPQDGPVLLINATIHPVSGDAIDKGWIRFADGRITGMGAGPVPESPDNAAKTVIDCEGKHVWPGIIAAWTKLGLEEISRIRPSTDLDEIGDVTPEALAAVAVNPDSTLIPVARHAGILTAGVMPSGSVIPGRASLMRLDGWTWMDMAVREDAALLVNWPRQRIIRAWWMNQSEAEQKKAMKANRDRIENAFAEAIDYHRARAEDSSRPIDLKLEAYAAFLPSTRRDGTTVAPRRPVFFSAQSRGQILGALAFAEKHGLRPVIVGGNEAEECALELSGRDVPVVVLGTLRTPRRADASYDDAYTLPARLAKAGVRFCIASGDSTGHQRNLPHHAGMAVAHGLDADRAMRAITLDVATIFEVDDRLGSLDKGKAATLIVTDGDPLEITTRVTRAFIDGKTVDLTSKQTVLRDKYRERGRQR